MAVATSLASAGVISERLLSSSPRRIAVGKFWLLFTNALVADHPRGASFFALVLFALVALAVCGARLAWVTAAMGHVFSTLCVYAMIALARLVDPSAFDRVLSGTDIGVSAICAAWLGAVAVVSWRRPTSTGTRKIAIAATCVLVALAAWLVHPQLTALDTDHLFAFAIGAAVAVVPVRTLVKADSLYALSTAACSRVRSFVLGTLRSTQRVGSNGS
ncbi:MAG TPA: hypothetical protein VE269_02445 [Gaiellaceae bacterium]|nr:hypothetical protein [Gaiellaceae bacterium]